MIRHGYCAVSFVLLFAFTTSAQGPIGYWNFDSVSGGVATDSINGNNGIWQNGTNNNLLQVVGQIGNAADLSDVTGNNYFQITDLNELNGASGVTLTAWIDPEGQNTVYNGVFMTRDFNNQSNNSWGLAYRTDGGGRIDTRVDGPGLVSANGSVPTSAGWTHIALTWDGATQTHRLFVNGAQASSTSTAGDPHLTSGMIANVSNGPWFLGYDNCCGGTRDFNGGIDDASAWNVALSNQRVDRIYQGGLVGQGANAVNDFTWNIPTDGNWGDANTWDLNADYPNMPGDVVFLVRDHAPNVDRTVTLDVADANAHRIVFDDPGANSVDAGWIINPTAGQSITMTVNVDQRGHLESYNHATNVVNAQVNLTGSFDEAYTLIDTDSTLHLAEGITYTSPGVSTLSRRLDGKLILGGTSTLDQMRVREVDGRPAAVNVDLDGGTLTLNQIHIEGSNNGRGLFEVKNGGQLNIAGAGSVFNVGGGGAFVDNTNPSGGAHTLTLTDGVITSNAPLTLVQNNGDATAQLDGGTLTVPQIRKGSGGGVARVQLNGVTIKPTGNHTDFMTTDLTTRIWDGGVTFDTDGFDITVNTFLGNQSGATTSSLTKEGAGTLTLTNGSNNYRGGTTINAGVLKAGGNFVLPDGTGDGNTTINTNGTLDIDGFRTTTNVLLGDGTIDNTGSSRNWLQPGSNNGSGTFSGDINSTGAFTDIMKVGTGEQTFDGTLNVGQVWSRHGTITLGPNGAMNAADGVSVNRAPTEGSGSAAFRVEGGTHNVSGGHFLIGNGAGGPGSYTQIAGSMTTANDFSVGQTQSGNLNSAIISAGDLNIGNNLYVGNGGNGEMTIAGSANVNVSGNTFVTNGSTSNGTLLQSSGTLLNDGNMTIGTTGGTGSGSYTLDNGTIDFGDSAPITQASTAPGNPPSTLTVEASGTFNFNGGTLMNVTTINHSSGATGDTLVQNGGNLVVGVDGNLDPSLAATTRATTNIVGNYTTSPGAMLSLDIFGNEAGDYYPGSLGGEGVVAVPSLTIDQVLNTDATASDLLIVGNADGTGLGTADFTAGLDLSLDTNGLNTPFLGFYDLVLAQEILLDDETFNLSGASMYRIIELADGSQLLQAAVPEPGSLTLWFLLAVGWTALGVCRPGKHVARLATKLKE